MVLIASISRSYESPRYPSTLTDTDSKLAGIAVRILGEVTPEKVEIARRADHIFISEIRKAGLYNQISQAFAALDPSRAVGVQGDKRVYGYIIILRAVTTTDFMTAEACEFLRERPCDTWAPVLKGTMKTNPETS